MKAPKKPQQQFHWHIYRIRGTPAASVGLVHAPDAETAIQRAIEEFSITDTQAQRRLVAVRTS